MKRRHARLGATSPLLVLLAAVGSAGPSAPRDGIEIAYLNQTWPDVAGSLESIREGPLAIQLSSPDARLTVHRNRLALTARSDGAPDAAIEAEVEGEGDLIADVSGGPMGTRLEDRVAAPRQTVRVEGRARVERDATGYTVTLVEGPPSAPIAIRSRLVGEIVDICEGVAVFGGMSCERVRASLSTVRVPLRGSTSVRLPRERLSSAERAYLDRFAAP